MTHRAPSLQKRHFEYLARFVRDSFEGDERDHVAHRLAGALVPTNPYFDKSKFLHATGAQS
jgi:hypothetical protein